jgi:hypothetical protein
MRHNARAFHGALLALAFVLLAALAGHVGAAYMTTTYVGTQQLAVGEAGTIATQVTVGRVTFGASATTGTLTLAGITTNTRILASIVGGNSSAEYIVSAVPTANTVTITLSGTPGASTPIDVLAFTPAP